MPHPLPVRLIHTRPVRDLSVVVTSVSTWTVLVAQHVVQHSLLVCREHWQSLHTDRLPQLWPELSDPLIGLLFRSVLVWGCQAPPRTLSDLLTPAPLLPVFPCCVRIGYVVVPVLRTALVLRPGVSMPGMPVQTVPRQLQSDVHLSQCHGVLVAVAYVGLVVGDPRLVALPHGVVTVKGIHRLG